MNFRQIDQFLCIVEQGSIGKAARALNISQPALTKSLHQLERELKVTLLTRSAFGVQLTVFGESLYAHGKRVNTEIARAEHDIEALRGAHRGRVSVGAIPLGARGILPDAMVRLSQKRGGLTISVVEKHNSELMSAFRKGDFDFIIALLDEEEVDGQFTIRELVRDELVAAMRRGHPALAQPSPGLPQLAAYPWIYPKPGSAHRRRIDECFRKAGLSQPAIAVEGGSEAFVAQLLVTTDYIAAVSTGVMEIDRNLSGLVSVRLGSEVAVRRIGIIHRGRASLSPAARALVSELERRPRS